MAEPPLIIGLGTGRCGTHSLVDVLNAQDGAAVVHEDKPILHWDPAQENSDVIARFQTRIDRAPGKITGEVALFLLGHAPALLEAFPQARAVVLQRPRDEVIASFTRWVRGSARHRRHMNHWQRGARRKRALWDRAFPQFDALTMQEAIGLYWDWYDRHVTDLMKAYPDRVRQWTMRQALNDPDRQREMLQWLGIENPRWHHAWSAWTKKPSPKPAGHDYTYCIKTFARPEALRRCLQSIRDRNPAHSVVVVDDSKEPYAAAVAAETPELDVRVITPGYDVGISRGRNLAIDATGTEFVCQFDDDMYLVDDTDVPGMVSALTDGSYDIVTGRTLEPDGRVHGWEARFRQKDTVLYARPYPPQERIQPVDMGMNFLVARTNTLQKFRYCNEIKIGREHLDFFLTVHRGGGRVACYAPSLIGHRHDKANRVYRRMRRDRRKAYDRLVMKRHGLSHVIMPTGEVLTCLENFQRLGPQAKWTDGPGNLSERDRKPPRILIGALSGAAKTARRDACRATWLAGIDARDDVQCVFLRGDPGLSKPELRGDELWLPCPDDYASLPQKTRGFCRWALANAQFEYLFKCDDDTYVCLDRLLQVPSGLDYCGWKLGRRSYASGGAGYLLSRRAAEVVARDVVEQTGPEDRLVGQHLHRTGIALVHDPRFRPWRKLSHTPRPDNDLITGHYCGHIRMRRVHRQFARR